MRCRKVVLTSLSPFDPSPFQKYGCRPLRISTIRLLPKREEILRLKENLSHQRHDSAVFLSPRSLRVVNPSKKIIRSLSEMRLYAVGPSTKASLEKFGLTKVRLPCRYTSKALLEEILSDHSEHPFSSIALLRSSFANDLMRRALSEGGIPVEEYRIYSPVVDPKGVEKFLRTLRTGADFVVFTSGSSFELMQAFLPFKARRKLQSLLKSTHVIAIGPETARVLKSSGIEPSVAPEPSLWGVLSSLGAA